MLEIVTPENHDRVKMQIEQEAYDGIWIEEWKLGWVVVQQLNSGVVPFAEDGYLDPDRPYYHATKESAESTRQAYVEREIRIQWQQLAKRGLVRL